MLEKDIQFVIDAESEELKNEIETKVGLHA